jgi:Outer membrane protein beta-barrel domain
MSRHLSFVRCFVFGVFLVATASAGAQIGIYGMGSGGYLTGPGVGANSSGSGSLLAWGGTFGVYGAGYGLGPIHLGGDLRGFVQNSGDNPGNKLLGVLAGPRLSFGLPPIPLRPYIQAEVGLGSTNYGVSADRSNHFAYQIQGGLDIAIIPHLDIRTEYGAGQIDGDNGYSTHQTLQEFGIGLGLRL